MPVEFHLHQLGLYLAMMKPLLFVALLSLNAVEVLSGEYRAVTIETGQRRIFRVPNLETITGSSGRCVEEGLDGETMEAIWIEASCEGVRTSMVWKKDGTRMHVMACAEDVETRTSAQLKLRQQVQKEVKAHKSVTACVRNGRVEVWGWVMSEDDLATFTTLEKKHRDTVKSFVEVVKPEQ